MAFELKNVFISDEVDPRCVDILQKKGINVVKDTKLRLNKEQFLTEIAKYDGLIVRSATKVTADVINAATNLKIIGRAGTGVDNIDCDAATQRGIIVMNTPGGNTLSAAEHTCALICSLSRDIPNAVATMKAGKWDRKVFMGNELFGKTLAIIGLGRIGKEVALRMQSFGMTTIGYDPIIPGSVSAEFNVEWMELEKLWPLADYITVHTPLIPQTRNLISDEVFKKCKPTVKVVNCARGGIIDEVALLKALNSNQCGGAGLDVFISEPPEDYTLAQHPKVIATPHLGASTVEAQGRVAVEIAEQFVDVVEGKSLFGAINAHAMHNALSPETKPWVALGRCLGNLMSKVNPGATSSVTVTAYGSGLEKAGSYLSAAVLSGLLSNTAGQGSTLNLVSAPALGKQLGVKVESKYEASAPLPYQSLVSVSCGGQTLMGTTSGGQSLLVGINNSWFPCPATLSGPVIVFSAQASPQLVSQVAGVLGSNGASVTGMSVSAEGQGLQWGVVNLTATPPESLFNITSATKSAFAASF